MTQDFEYMGYWNISTETELKYPGVIRYNNSDGITLELLGTPRGKEYYIDPVYDIPMIKGFTDCGKHISLHDCQAYESRPMPGINSTTVNAKYAFIGNEYLNEEDLSFDLLAIHYLYLDEWVDISGFSVLNDYKNEKRFNVSLTYKQPEPVELYKCDDFEILLWFSARGPAFTTDLKSNEISQKVYVNVIFKKKENLQNALEIITKLRNFLSLGISKIINVNEITAYRYGVVKDQESKSKFQLIYKEDYYPTKIDSHLRDSYMLFSLKDISSNCVSILENWFSKYQSLRPVFDLYFESLYNPKLYPTNHFLNLTFALETYHRRTKNKPIYNEDDYNNLTKILIDAAPENAREWLGGKLKFANEANLGIRLKEICKSLKPIISEFEDDIKSFTYHVVNTRNYLVHFSEELKSKAIPSEKLYKYNLSLAMILQLCIMQELGFSEEEMKKSIKRPIRHWSKFEKKKTQ